MPYFGWGDLPDRYGRRWDGDDGEAEPQPADAVGAGPRRRDGGDVRAADSVVCGRAGRRDPPAHSTSEFEG
ncbi:hypothetical protein [Micromonospora lutea]|uniref:Uncharacterized protein n=1 Tax=Micromonospora lutea TaxID=419825 RepID=A0ABQ4J208_9ACTN|nr:hypothetical protein [Micromonospora lutea]GIJ24221.1 hypothetical protein Vlu01_48450 [Micromonospora lutea]